MDSSNVMIIIIAIISIIVISLTLFATVIKLALIVMVVFFAFGLLDKTNSSSFLGSNLFGMALTNNPKPPAIEIDGLKSAFAPIEGKELQNAVNIEKTDLLTQDDVLGEYENRSTIYPMFSFTQGLAFPDTEAVIPMTAKDFDDRSTLKQKHIGNKNRDAIAGAVSATRNVFDRYIRGELDENESRVWYSSEANMSSDFFSAF